MLIDKARHWRGLLLAAFMNLHAEVFAELLTGYVGKGVVVAALGFLAGAAVGGYDVERYVYDVLAGLRCAPWFPAYASGRALAGEEPLVTDLDGFHPVPDYTTFRDYYRGGWTGPVESLALPPLGWADRLSAWYQGGLRWRLRPLGRKLCRLRRRLLPRKFRCRG
ncbi:hypothetical protein GPECTOR_15g313 [Gonium pectorale]|uniref:Uncharacterized protein n=1 Tax=Gonium pectorale TaxID=33097 RepID=A0A150GLA1_GONPE|nr:hypothetical protein GPECTOR_15g313 [Gonium pectorale]|eukprot:KXZ50629.1 hypothetical protein GPECTOR_15g313 [Gonium pectorale]